ncbi:MAG: hypothetical protein HKN03_01260 [Acidimicrobiales bacterium]|nr:hypothetical protein [Acidimicrobiales bacterium]
MGRGESPVGLVALAAVGLGVCCGVPLLLAAGATVTVAGIGIRSWALVLAGVSVAALAFTVSRRRTGEHQRAGQESVDAH